MCHVQTQPHNSCYSLAGVSCSTTVVMAYLMTVTSQGWEECLTAVKSVRSFVCPNYGFQQQLQEFQMKQVSEVHSAFHRKILSRHSFQSEFDILNCLTYNIKINIICIFSCQSIPVFLKRSQDHFECVMVCVVKKTSRLRM